MSSIAPHTPLRLERAAELAFPEGGVTAAMLAAQAKRGRLTVERIGGRLFTTLADIEEMRERCRQKPRGHGCGGDEEPEDQTASVGRAIGSSKTTVESDTALASARLVAADLRKRLKTPSQNMSSANGKSHASTTVLPIKSG